MSKTGELLVAIINNQLDFSIARDKHWYRIPVASVKKLLKGKWPPQWLAFYHTKAFKGNAHTITHFAQVLKIGGAKRWQLFPELPLNEKSDHLNYQLLISPLKKLPNPIFSRRWKNLKRFRKIDLMLPGTTFHNEMFK